MTGLAGILSATAEGLVRPLLDVSREAVREWLTARGVSWREDSTNRDPAFRRNRIRLELLPALERDWNPALSVALAQLGEVAAAEESWWRSEVASVADDVISQESQLGLLIDASRLVRLHPALARRVLRFAVERAKGDIRRISFRHIEALYGLARRHGSGKTRLPGLEACRSFDWILLGAPYTRQPASMTALTVPGSHRLDDGAILQLELVSAPPYSPVDSRYTYTGNDLDWDLVKVTGLCCRPWRPGDRYRPLALNREEKLKELFQRARVPLWKRHLWPIITSGDAIAWVREFGVAASYAVTATTTTVLRVSELAQSQELQE
jgi:tRNA(Ile)-lysidine synthase